MTDLQDSIVYLDGDSDVESQLEFNDDYFSNEYVTTNHVGKRVGKSKSNIFLNSSDDIPKRFVDGKSRRVFILGGKRHYKKGHEKIGSEIRKSCKDDNERAIGGKEKMNKNPDHIWIRENTDPYKEPTPEHLSELPLSVFEDFGGDDY